MDQAKKTARWDEKHLKLWDFVHLMLKIWHHVFVCKYLEYQECCQCECPINEQYKCCPQEAFHRQNMLSAYAPWLAWLKWGAGGHPTHTVHCLFCPLFVLSIVLPWVGRRGLGYGALTQPWPILRQLHRCHLNLVILWNVHTFLQTP